MSKSRQTNSDILHPTNIPSYAQITKNKAPLMELPAIVITPTDKNINPATLRQELNNLPPNIIGIKDCRTTRTGQLIIRGKDKETLEKLTKEIEKDENLKLKMKLDHKDPKGKRIIIFSIPSIVTTEELEEKIRETYPFAKMIKSHKKHDKDSFYHQVVELDDLTASNILKDGRILIRINSCIVRRFVSVPRCFKCQRFGHMASSCDNISKKKNFKPGYSCQYCASNHSSEGCQYKEDPDKHCCINCKDSNKYQETNFDIHHTAASDKCSSYRLFLNAERANKNLMKNIR